MQRRSPSAPLPRSSASAALIQLGVLLAAQNLGQLVRRRQPFLGEGIGVAARASAHGSRMALAITTCWISLAPS